MLKSQILTFGESTYDRNVEKGLAKINNVSSSSINSYRIERPTHIRFECSPDRRRQYFSTIQIASLESGCSLTYASLGLYASGLICLSKICKMATKVF